MQPDGRCLRHDGCPPYLGRTRGGQGAGPELRPRARCLLNAVVAKVFQVALHASEASGMLSVLSRVFLDIDGVVVGSVPAEQRLRGSRIEVAEGLSSELNPCTGVVYQVDPIIVSRRLDMSGYFGQHHTCHTSLY